MGKRDIGTEVLHGLHEVREHRAGRKQLRSTQVEPAVKKTDGTRTPDDGDGAAPDPPDDKN